MNCVIIRTALGEEALNTLTSVQLRFWWTQMRLDLLSPSQEPVLSSQTYSDLGRSHGSVLAHEPMFPGCPSRPCTCLGLGLSGQSPALAVVKFGAGLVAYCVAGILSAVFPPAPTQKSDVRYTCSLPRPTYLSV